MRPRRPRVLPFPTPVQSPPTGGSPPRRYPGLVATVSLDAKEVARLVARDLADEWVKGLIADHQSGMSSATRWSPASTSLAWPGCRSSAFATLIYAAMRSSLGSIESRRGSRPIAAAARTRPSPCTTPAVGLPPSDRLVRDFGAVVRVMAATLRHASGSNFTHQIVEHHAESCDGPFEQPSSNRPPSLSLLLKLLLQ